MEGEKRVVARIGEVEVDFTDCGILTMGDKIRLKREYKLDFETIREDPEAEVKLILYVARRQGHPELTQEQVEALPMVEAQQLLVHLINRSMKVDRPFSTPSTSSGGTTGGGS